MAFKTADNNQRQKEVDQRTRKGLAYLNPEFNFPTFNAVDGDNSIRLVPPLLEDKDATLWGMDIWCTYINGVPYLSPKTFNKAARDPLQDIYNKLKQQDAELAKKFKPGKRSLTFLLNMNNTDEELQIWAAPASVIDEFLKISKNRRTGALIPIEDPVTGPIIFFNKQGTGINTRYGGFILDQSPFPLPADLDKEMVTFRELLIVKSPEELDVIIADAMESLKNGGGNDTEGGADSARPQAHTRRPSEEAVDQTAAPPAPAAAVSQPAPSPTTEPVAPATTPAPAAQAPSPPPPSTPAQPAAASSPEDLKRKVQERMAARRAAATGGDAGGSAA